VSLNVGFNDDPRGWFARLIFKPSFPIGVDNELF
jgi:hypothetical protein